MNSRNELYDEFVGLSPQGTLFCTSWWLEAVAPGCHRIITVEKGGETYAAWPIVLRRSRMGGQVIITNPPLTPWLGILYRGLDHGPTRSSKTARQLAMMKELALDLVQQLPKFDAVDVSFHRNFDYWSPLYWRGFRQTTRYTYVADDLSDLDALWARFEQNARHAIRRAQREGITVDCTENIREFWRINAMSFDRQAMAVPYSFDLVRRVDDACKARSKRKIFVARDKAGEIHAAGYIVWDSKSAYYLMASADPHGRSSGAQSLVTWEAIRFASAVTRAFDFEGSMIESVEQFLRAFGGSPFPYFRISKVNSPLWFAYQTVRDLASLTLDGISRVSSKR